LQPPYKWFRSGLSFHLRPADSSDFPEIRALIRSVHINPLGLNWEHFILAVNSQDKMIGCGQVKIHRDGSRELASIAVVPAWRGKGVARAIIEKLVEDHPEELYLTCRASLQPFYERFGFRVIETSQMPKYFRRVSRLASALGVLRIVNQKLLVMKREATL
jgi:amino-acid N-acetyltransferase